MQSSMRYGTAIDSIKAVIATSQSLAAAIQEEATAHQLIHWPSCESMALEAVNVITDLTLPDPDSEIHSLRIMGYVVVPDKGDVIPITNQLNSLKEEAKAAIAELKQVKDRNFSMRSLSRDEGLEELLSITGMSKRLNLVALYRKLNVLTDPLLAVGYHGSFQATRTKDTPYRLVEVMLSSERLKHDPESVRYRQLSMDLEKLATLPNGAHYVQKESVTTAPMANVTYETADGRQRVKRYASLPFVITESAMASQPVMSFPEFLDRPKVGQASRWDKRDYVHCGIRSLPLYRMA